MSRKFIIELDDKTFEELKQGFMEAKKLAPNLEEISFEQFLSDLLKSYADVKEQMGMMGDNFKNMFANMDGSSIEEMLSKLSKFANSASNDEEITKKEKANGKPNKTKESKNNDKPDEDLLNKFKS